MTQEARLSSTSLGRAAAIALWVALVGGVIEVVVLQIQRWSHPMLPVSRDFFWMAPAALTAAVLCGVAPCLLVARVWTRHAGCAAIVFVASSLVLLDLLLLVRGFNHYAAALLAAGAALQSARFVLRHPTRTWRFVRRSVPALAGGYAVLAATASLSSAQPGSAAPPLGLTQPVPRPLNVLLITLDTVRAANLSLYGYARPTTPNLDRFATRGVVFDRAFAAAPWTLPSHATMFTGRWPHELSADHDSALDAKYPTLAERLAARGYATAGFVANLHFCGSETGLGRGFQHYEDYPRSLGQFASNSTLLRNVADNFTVRRMIENDQHLNRIDASDVNQRILDWLSTHQNAPFFIFANYFDAHEPYLPPEPFARRFGAGRQRGRYSPLHHWLWDVSVGHRKMTVQEEQEEVDSYDSAIAYLDDRVGALLAELDARHRLDDTLVVITADHGEEFGEHAVFDHGYSLYRQSLHVPLMLVAPGRAPAARRVVAPVSLRDLPATVMHVAGADEAPPFPGRSLSSHWDPLPPQRDDASLSEVSRAAGQPEWFPASKGDMRSLIYRGLHYIRNGDGSEELYDVDRDPAERNDLASLSQYGEAVAASRTALQNIVARPR